LSKVLGWIVTTGIVFTGGYGFLLPESYQMLVDWLGPMMGLSIRTVLTCLYLTFGDPLFLGSLLLPLWIFAAFVGGLISRRSLGGIAVAISSYTLLLTLMSLSAFKIIQSVGSISQLSAIVLPPMPMDFSTYELFNAPVIGPLIQQVFSSLSFIGGGGGQPDLSTAIWGIAYILALNAVKILVPACIAGLVGGFIGGRIWGGVSHRRYRVKEESLVATVIILLLGIAAFQASLIPVTSAANGTVISPSVIEGLGGSVQPDGSVIVASGFTAPAAGVMKGIPAEVLEGSILILLATQYFQPGSLPQLPEEASMLSAEQVTGLYPAFPSTFLVTIYKGGAGNESSARIVASTLSDQLGMQFSSGISVEQEVGEDVNITISLFLAGESYVEAEKVLMDMLEGEEGLAAYVYDVYRNGVFTPDATSWSANGTAIALGLVNGWEALELFSGVSEQFNLPAEALAGQLFEENKLTPFLLQVSFWKQAYHSSPQEHTFDLAEFLRTTEPITASPSADVSLLLLNVPSLEGLGEGWNALGEGLAVKALTPGETVLEVATSFNQTFPARLLVTKSMNVTHVAEGGAVRVTVEVWNNDTAPVYDVALDDASTQGVYASAVNLTEDSYSERWNVLLGGERINHSYTLALDNIGVYTLPPAQVEYSAHEETYVTSSGVAVVRVDHPPVLEVFKRGATLLWGMTAMFADAIVPPYGAFVASVIALLIIVGVVASIVLSFRRPKPVGSKG